MCEDDIMIIPDFELGARMVRSEVEGEELLRRIIVALEDDRRDLPVPHPLDFQQVR